MLLSKGAEQSLSYLLDWPSQSVALLSGLPLGPNWFAKCRYWFLLHIVLCILRLPCLILSSWQREKERERDAAFHCSQEQGTPDKLVWGQGSHKDLKNFKTGRDFTVQPLDMKTQGLGWVLGTCPVSWLPKNLSKYRQVIAHLICYGDKISVKEFNLLFYNIWLASLTSAKGQTFFLFWFGHLKIRMIRVKIKLLKKINIFSMLSHWNLFWTHMKFPF